MGMIGINALAKRIIGNYDRNRDGVISLDPKKGETFRRESIYQPDETIISTWSRERLFARADANNDGQVTADELSAVIATFDENHNNGLETRRWIWEPKTEYDRFEDAWGEDLVDQQIIHHPQPPVPPIPNPPFPHRQEVQYA